MKKKVMLTYDSENKKISATFSGNLACTDDGRIKSVGTNLDVLKSERFVLEAAKECLEEMLELVDEIF